MKDKLIEDLINKELERQQNNIELIASENIVSKDVLEAMGSILTNKYAEGRLLRQEELKDEMSAANSALPERLANRYYNGCHIIDKIEYIACARFRELFDTNYHVNVQPHSGAQANMAVMEALLKEGDTILSMDLSNGGHLSHGSPVNYSGKHYNIISYGINENGEIDYDNVENTALFVRPKLIICGASNYSKIIDFERFAQIRDKLLAEKRECYLLADIAHIAGLVAAGVHPSPFGYADVITTTTHKSLRGPRGGVIACKSELAKKIDSAVFPGTQGGPLEHIIAAKAVCFGEALDGSFREYANQIVKNAKALCQGLLEEGIDVVGNMTENHVMTIDVRKYNRTGKDIANELEQIGITANKNTVPNDPQSPFITSGVRLGTPAVTTRGFKEEDMKVVASIISKVVKGNYNKEELRNQCSELCKKYPLEY